MTAAQWASTAAGLRANALTRPGHVFAGWNTKADGIGRARPDLAGYPFPAAATLHAQWRPGRPGIDGGPSAGLAPPSWRNTPLISGPQSSRGFRVPFKCATCR
ncbi:MAG: InlB B-repeat-containing protein [Actinomycetia bacterium]|nr:InlB B-repeat-containing protein [Actinomycetes bacterium]